MDQGKKKQKKTCFSHNIYCLLVQRFSLY